MDIHLHPTRALLPGHGRPDSAGQGGSAATGTGSTAPEAPRTVTAGVEITVSAKALAALADGVSADGSGKSGLSPAHLARSSQVRAFAVDTYKNFGQLVAAIARGLDGSDTEEPAAVDETATVPATDEGAVAPETSENAVVADETEEAAADGETEEVAAEEPAAVEGEESAGGEVVVDTGEVIDPTVIIDPDSAVIEELAAEDGSDSAVVDEPEIVVETESLEDTLLEALADSETDAV